MEVFAYITRDENLCAFGKLETARQFAEQDCSVTPDERPLWITEFDKGIMFLYVRGRSTPVTRVYFGEVQA